MKTTRPFDFAAIHRGDDGVSDVQPITNGHTDQGDLSGQSDGVWTWKVVEQRAADIWSATARMNPLTRTVQAFFRDCAIEARSYCLEKLEQSLTRLAEHPRIRGCCASVFAFDGMNGLVSVAGRNRSADTSVVSLDDTGIPQHVAKTRDAYIMKTASDPLYRCQFEGTQSEIAVPIIGLDGNLLGVLNFECVKPEAYDNSTLQWIEKRLSTFRTQLEVLRAVQSTPEQCPWHPSLHGSNFREIMTRLCKVVAKALGEGISTCTAWYCDPAKKSAFAFATCGYDYQFLSRESLPLHLSKVGKVFWGHETGVIPFVPSEDEDFLNKAKAAEMGITEGFMIRVPSVHGRKRGEVVLAIYTRGRTDDPEESERRRVIVEGLPEVAVLIQKSASHFLTQHRRHIIDSVREGVEQDVANVFTILLPKIVKTLGAQAGSIFGAVPNSDRLKCLSTTGFLVEANESSTVNGLLEYGYSLKRHSSSFTVNAALHPYEAIRTNHTDDAVEPGLPKWLPKDSKPTAMLKEAIHGSVPKKRRLLMVGFSGADGSRGVLRLVRKQNAIPFLECDERLIEGIARELGNALTRWSQDSSSVLDTERPLYQLISQPGLMAKRG